jgi:hypothetical protein
MTQIGNFPRKIVLQLRHPILRFLAGVHVFEAAEIQIREQILNSCLLLDSGLRHYEIKLDRGFSAEKTFSRSSFLQIGLWAAD